MGIAESIMTGYVSEGSKEEVESGTVEIEQDKKKADASIEQVIKDFVNALKQKYDVKNLKDTIIKSVTVALDSKEVETEEEEEEVSDTFENSEDKRLAQVITEKTQKFIDKDLI